MAKTKIMPGELFIVEYVDGAFENRWAVNASKDYIEIEPGRLATIGSTDVLVEPEDAAGNIIDSRYHIVSNKEAIKFLDEVGFREQSFATVPLQVLKVAKDTEIYSRSGVLLGTIPAGSEIGTDTAAAGNSMRYLMVANAFNDGTGWKFINQQDYSYGFVNVQKGNGLQRFDANRNVITAVTETPALIDWTTIANVIATNAPELVLRGDLTALTKEQVVEKVRDHFATVDLADVELMDPVQFFANANNRAFVERELGKIDPVLASNFALNADKFVTE